MDNEQEDLEAIVQQDSYGLAAITETRWDDSHDWSAVMDGYGALQKGQARKERRWGGSVW